MRVLVKALILFVSANMLFAVTNPLPQLSRLSGYNVLWPGRSRLPYADNPNRAYSLTLDNLDAMFASHEIARAKSTDEYRVVLVGDSSTWGWFLRSEESLAGRLNQRGLVASDGRHMRFYNLGYPIMSLAKDVLILNRAMTYKPDLVLWLTTLESFPLDKQYSHPLILANHEELDSFKLDLSGNAKEPCSVASFMGDCGWLISRTIVAHRRELADLARLQLYGIQWAATGIDQDIPVDYEPAARDYDPDESFHGLLPPALSEKDLALNVLITGIGIARQHNVPIAVINEPILISSGRNSTVRYNFLYPRWAYDQYRHMLSQVLGGASVPFLDAWDALPVQYFTNTAVHESPAGVRLFEERLAGFLRSI